MAYNDNMEIASYYDDLVKNATRTGGEVFGGFVKNIAIPRSFDPHYVFNVTYGIEINLWFKNRHTCDAFLLIMKDKVIKQHSHNGINNYQYKSSIYTFELGDNNKIIAWMNIVVSDVCPYGNKFNVDEVCCQRINKTYIYKRYTYGTDVSVVLDANSPIIDSILKKSSTITITYANNILQSLNRGDEWAAKIAYEYMHDGWKITIPAKDEITICSKTCSFTYFKHLICFTFNMDPHLQSHSQSHSQSCSQPSSQSGSQSGSQSSLQRSSELSPQPYPQHCPQSSSQPSPQDIEQVITNSAPASADINNNISKNIYNNEMRGVDIKDIKHNIISLANHIDELCHIMKSFQAII